MISKKKQSLTVVRVIFLNNRKEILDYPSLLFLNIHHLKSIISNNIVNNRVHQYQSLDLIPIEQPMNNSSINGLMIKHTLNVE